MDSDAALSLRQLLQEELGFLVTSRASNNFHALQAIKFLADTLIQMVFPCGVYVVCPQNYCHISLLSVNTEILVKADIMRDCYRYVYKILSIH
jgi:hypothetical protein